MKNLFELILIPLDRNCLDYSSSEVAVEIIKDWRKRNETT